MTRTTLRFHALALLVLALVLGAGGSAIANREDERKDTLRDVGELSTAPVATDQEAQEPDATPAPKPQPKPQPKPEPKPEPKPQGPSRAEIRRQQAAERRAAL